ncbi:unnamed protein product [Cercopithifilaria johnstoni]|uniref:Uncharacterized protein n=1 Tax=Cercopithifilaria johnstoni TaxID=2874296 RepID=A0A8J2M470_9BILA|nr:unnamed protein product [Cercopithifilaria johnstoni]
MYVKCFHSLDKNVNRDFETSFYKLPSVFRNPCTGEEDTSKTWEDNATDALKSQEQESGEETRRGQERKYDGRQSASPNAGLDSPRHKPRPQSQTRLPPRICIP